MKRLARVANAHEPLSRARPVDRQLVGGVATGELGRDRDITRHAELQAAGSAPLIPDEPLGGGRAEHGQLDRASIEVISRYGHVPGLAKLVANDLPVVLADDLSCRNQELACVFPRHEIFVARCGEQLLGASAHLA